MVTKKRSARIKKAFSDSALSSYFDGRIERQSEVLKWYANGLVVSQIAEKLKARPFSIEGHIESIHREFGVTTQTEFIAKIAEDQNQQINLRKNEEVFSEFFAMTEAQQAAAAKIMAGRSFFQRCMELGISAEQLQKIDLSLEDKDMCGTLDRAGLLSFFYGPASHARLVECREDYRLTGQEYDIVRLTIKGYSEQKIHERTGMDLATQKCVREPILAKMGAVSMEGVFAVVHGVRLEPNLEKQEAKKMRRFADSMVSRASRPGVDQQNLNHS